MKIINQIKKCHSPANNCHSPALLGLSPSGSKTRLENLDPLIKSEDDSFKSEDDSLLLTHQKTASCEAVSNSLTRFVYELPCSRADKVSAEAESSSCSFIPGASSEVFVRKNNLELILRTNINITKPHILSKKDGVYENH